MTDGPLVLFGLGIPRSVIKPKSKIKPLIGTKRYALISECSNGYRGFLCMLEMYGAIQIKNVAVSLKYTIM